MSEEIEPHIINRFEVIKKIGSGAYGHVWKVIDRKTRKTKALKKNFDAFNNSTDAQRTYRQIMFLTELSHPHVIRLQQVIRAENNKDIYLVFEHMDIDLYTLIRQNILAQKHKKFILYQMAKALLYLHGAGLIHRDVKPSNVLVNQSCEAKLCDFGLVRSVDDESDEQMDILTEYIATRWYRAPQILLGSIKYTKAIDIWSFGCLLAQMMRGKPLFPGTSTMNQIQRVLMWTGPPTESQVKALKITSGCEVFKMMAKVKKINKKEMLPNASDSCLDLISKCLAFSPQARPTIQDIIQHPYLQQFFAATDLQVSTMKIKIPVDDNERLSLKQYRNIIYEEIRKKNKSAIEGNTTLYRIKNAVKKSIGKKNDLLDEDAVTKESAGREGKTCSMNKYDQKCKLGMDDRIRGEEKKKSIYKRDPLLLNPKKHLKTIEKEWEPLIEPSSKKTTLHYDDDPRTKCDWNRKKRSATESNGKKLRMLPSPAELRAVNLKIN